ncbi:MAG: hypothetical protein AAGA56_16925, partial [Myxococcota bacterium]
MRKRIDFYVQQIVRHKAEGVELVSEKPVKFLFAGGARNSNKRIDHAQVVQVVKEASPQAVDDVLEAGHAAFAYAPDGGPEVQVSVSAMDANTWGIRIVPGDNGGGAAPAPRARAAEPRAGGVNEPPPAADSRARAAAPPAAGSR